MQAALGDDLVVVTKHVPRSHDRASQKAALAAIAAASLGAGPKFTAHLQRHRATLSHADLSALADEIGLDGAKLKALMKAEETTKMLAAHQAEAKALGLERRPSLFVNGVPVHQVVSREALKTLILRERTVIEALGSDLKAAHQKLLARAGEPVKTIEAGVKEIKEPPREGSLPPTIAPEDFSWGDPNAPVQIVEFADYQCLLLKDSGDAGEDQGLQARRGLHRLPDLPLLSIRVRRWPRGLLMRRVGKGSFGDL